jgi:thiamine biosynthesis lipoprotein
MPPATPSPNRRDFLTGRAAQRELERVRDEAVDRLLAERPSPGGGGTVRVATTAMACEFAVLLNPGPVEETWAASEVLDVVHALEDQMTVYRPHSELSQINRRAADGPVPVEHRLFDLLLRARDISRQTEGAFDPTSGPLIALWRECKKVHRVPTAGDVQSRLARTGVEKVEFDEAATTVRYRQPGVELNLGGIGKGHALDVAEAELRSRGIDSFLFHGGHSSVVARGGHNGIDGWPVGLRNPLFPTERLGTLLLRDRALSSSGTSVQFYRHRGKRYGHILDPRTGWPAQGLVATTVMAPSAAEADALSTAFFVLGLEKAQAYCDNRRDVSALLVPPPSRGRELQPIRCNLPDEFWV